MGDLKLNVKLSQQLIMTPQLQQAIKLLQLSRLELQQTITNELMENPVLEEVIDTPDPNIVTEVKEEKPVVDEGWQDYIDVYNSNSSAPPSATRSYNRSSEDGFNLENIGTRTENLYDHYRGNLKCLASQKKRKSLVKRLFKV